MECKGEKEMTLFLFIHRLNSGKWGRGTEAGALSDFAFHLPSQELQSADIGLPTGNGKKLSNCQACCLAQLCLGAA